MGTVEENGGMRVYEISYVLKCISMKQRKIRRAFSALVNWILRSLEKFC